MAELPKKVSRDLTIELVDRLDQVFELAFDDWTVPVLKPEERMDKTRPESPLPPVAGPY